MPRDHKAEIKLLEELGQACFGEHWQGDFARAFDVNPRALQRWLAGENIIPLRNWERITDAAFDRIRALNSAALRADQMWRAALDEVQAKP